MDICELTWDSDFFNQRIGRLTGKDEIEIKKTLGETSPKDWDLLYIMLEEEPMHPYSSNLGELMDEKLTYEFEIKPGQKFIMYPEIQSILTLTPKLLELTLVSGHKSRFKKDRKFGNAGYEKLYTTWIEKSLEGSMADICLGYYVQNNLAGFLTVKFEEKVSHIGLVAVDSSFRHQGIGSKLIEAAKYYTNKKGLKKIQVITQKENTGACNLYEKNGFILIKDEYIFHKWLVK